jgi:hypothetical protein
MQNNLLTRSQIKMEESIHQIRQRSTYNEEDQFGYSNQYGSSNVFAGRLMGGQRDTTGYTKRASNYEQPIRYNT